MKRATATLRHNGRIRTIKSVCPSFACGRCYNRILADFAQIVISRLGPTNYKRVCFKPKSYDLSFILLHFTSQSLTRF